MPHGLVRWQDLNDTHFVTFSCYQRQPYFSRSALCDIFLVSLERTRRQYSFLIYGYVVMPEHVHLLVSEPREARLCTALQALKVGFVRRSEELHNGTFWQKRYYDHNVRNYKSFTDKLGYIHYNPVKRGLCRTVLDWKWSSFQHYATAEIGPVEIESEWTASRRLGREPRLLGVHIGVPVQ